jgi:hypothetical protein
MARAKALKVVFARRALIDSLDLRLQLFERKAVVLEHLTAHARAYMTPAFRPLVRST